MSDSDSKSEELVFHYIKSPDYRNIYVDGAHGGISPKGMFCINLFNERHAIPTLEVYDVEADKTTKLKNSESKGGYIRNVEATLILDYNTMKSLKSWISEKLDNYDKLIEKSKEAK